MKQLTGMFIIMIAASMLAGCQTDANTYVPDMQSIQPSKQDQDRAKMSNAIQSTGL